MSQRSKAKIKRTCESNFGIFYLKSIWIIFKHYNYNIIMIILMYSGNTYLNNLFDSYLMPWNYCIKCFNLQRIVHKKLLHDQSGLFCFFFSSEKMKTSFDHLTMRLIFSTIIFSHKWYIWWEIWALFGVHQTFTKTILIR